MTETHSEEPFADDRDAESPLVIPARDISRQFPQRGEVPTERDLALDRRVAEIIDQQARGEFPTSRDDMGTEEPRPLAE